METGLARRIAIVGRTAADVRDVMIEGEAGILAVSPPWGPIVPYYEPSKRRVTWRRGGESGIEIAVATTFSDEAPDQLRGPTVDTAWCDELAAWENLAATWLNLEGRMRLGPHPQICVTTTPRPIALLREIAADSATVVVRGSSLANAANQPERYKRTLKRHAGTTHGRQEIDGEILDDRVGSVFSGAWLQRRDEAPASLMRVAISIDPASKEKKDSDETGIVAGGSDLEGNAYVLEDGSGHYSPEGWAARAIQMYDDHGADCIVVETNRGGDMVAATIRAALRDQGRNEREIRVVEVHASRGKVTRAEPVAQLYEQGRIFHVGPAKRYELLEKQMINWDPSAAASPDRVDALVWLMTYLGLVPDARAGFRGLERANANAPGQRFGGALTSTASGAGAFFGDETGGRFL